MLYMLINRTREGLSEADYARLGELARDFYAQPPEGIRLVGDWSALDRSRTFSLLEVDDPTALERLQAPYRSFVDIETIPVTEVKGWGS